MSEKPTDYLIATCFEFGGRGFAVTIGHDGISSWLDETSAGEEFRQTGGHVMLAMIGDKKARRDYARIYGKHTIQVPVPPGELRVIRDELAPKYWADDFESDHYLDMMLEPLFWSHVNPKLEKPCTKP